MFANLGSSEVLIIAVVLMVLLGSQKMSDLARGLGETQKEVKRMQKEYEDALKDDPKPEKKKEKKEEE